jgi:hypothetical protein
MLGTPVVDDYSFLDRLSFQHPLDTFDSMGASYYWRPLSRQAYFLVIGHWLLRAPATVAAIHAVLLLLLFFVVYRTARRGFAPPVAAAIATFPLLADSARVLLGWPSAAQHLLAVLGVAITVHETLAGRWWTAALAALAALLSHDSAVFVLPLLPAIAWLRTKRMREALLWGGAAVAVVAVWAIGYSIARSHGVALPPSSPTGYPAGKLVTVLTRGLWAQLDLEDASSMKAAIFGTLYVALLLIALVRLAGREGRERFGSRAPVVWLGLLFFVLASMPLPLLLPDWNSWRGTVPALGLGVGLVALAGLASPWLAGAFVALRLIALLLAPTAPLTVSRSAPPTASHMSFVRLARLQRTVDGARRALTTRFPTLRKGAEIRYWSMPLLCEVGFQDAKAARVWYGDSTITWGKFGGMEGIKRDFDAVVEFESDDPKTAVIVEPNALRIFRDGLDVFRTLNYARADSIFLEAERAQPPGASQFVASLARNRAAVAFNQGKYALADSLTEADFKLAGPTPGHFTMVARLAIVRNDRMRAITAVRECLLLDPTDRDGRMLGQALGLNLQAETGR